MLHRKKEESGIETDTRGVYFLAYQGCIYSAWSPQQRRVVGIKNLLKRRKNEKIKIT